MFIIHKGLQLSDDFSYSGDVWDKASLRHLYQEQYESRKEAQELADILSMWNSVEFKISRV